MANSPPALAILTPFTDPPYYGNVQYAELMDFCYVWLRKLIDDPAFKHHTTRALLDQYVTAVFSGLESEFLTMPQG
jgi:adenine-specific DNA methylase